MRRIGFVLVIVSIVMVAGAVQALAAESAAEFFQGKVVTIYTQSPAGSTSDFWARTLAVTMPKYTGAKFAVQNSPAGGGRVIQNAFANKKKPNGLHVMFTSAGTIWPAAMTGDPSVKFDITAYQYIGGLEMGNTLVAVSPKGKIKSLDDLRKAKGLVFAASNKTSLLTYANALVIDILGLDGKIITGFKGSTGRLLAMTQGDADGLVTSPSAVLRAMKDDTMLPLVQVGIKRTPPLTDVPCMMEFVKTENLNKTQKVLVDTINLLQDPKFLFAPPGTPQDRMAFLKDAFKKATQDPEMNERVVKATGEDIPPLIRGDALDKLAKELNARKSEMEVWDELLEKHIKK